MDYYLLKEISYINQKILHLRNNANSIDKKHSSEAMSEYNNLLDEITILESILGKLKECQENEF